MQHCRIQGPPDQNRPGSKIGGRGGGGRHELQSTTYLESPKVLPPLPSNPIPTHDSITPLPLPNTLSILVLPVAMSIEVLCRSNMVRGTGNSSLGSGTEGGRQGRRRHWLRRVLRLEAAFVNGRVVEDVTDVFDGLLHRTQHDFYGADVEALVAEVLHLGGEIVPGLFDVSAVVGRKWSVMYGG